MDSVIADITIIGLGIPAMRDLLHVKHGSYLVRTGYLCAQLIILLLHSFLFCRSDGFDDL